MVKGWGQAALLWTGASGDLERELGKQRVPRLLPWLDQRQPDVVCLQETKLRRRGFTAAGDELAGRGYAVALRTARGQWNGVAILSRVGLDDVVRGAAGAPGSRARRPAVAATCDGIRVYSVYVPNGRRSGSTHYRYKLAWLAALRDRSRPDRTPPSSAGT